MTNRIATYIAAGEGTRAQKLALVIAEDPRFEPLEVNAEIPLDCQFVWQDRVFNAEFKEVSDYVTSALSPSGHLFMQILAAREAGYPCIVVVLGGDTQVSDACYRSLKTRYSGDQLKYELESYKKRLQDFEARCLANGCPVMRWQIDPFTRLLSTAHKVLVDGSMMDYRPTPAEGERELTAASMMFAGIGPKIMSNILEEYTLCFAPRGDYARPIEEIEGIGRKRAEQINPHIRMTYLDRVRC